MSLKLENTGCRWRESKKFYISIHYFKVIKNNIFYMYTSNLCLVPYRVPCLFNFYLLI